MFYIKAPTTELQQYLWKTFSVIIIFLAFNTSAQIGVSPESVHISHCINMSTMKGIPCSDSELFFKEGRGPVQEAINSENFEQLDKLYEQWCTGKDRFPDGRWKLSQYGDGLSENFSVWNKWERDLQTIKKWQKSNPKSEAAQYIEAVYWRTFAWRARGSGYASTVSKEGWELFRERLNKSKEILDKLSTGSIKCPAPYAAHLSLLTDLNASEDEMNTVFNEGTKRFPEYHNIYFSMSIHYQPKWGGSIEEYDAFAKHTAEKTKKFEGMGMYARLYWLVDYQGGLPFHEKENKLPEWSKLKAGYADLMKKYPYSIHNLGKYMDVSCRSSDSKLYRELRSKISGYEESIDMVDSIDVCDRRHQWIEPTESK